jgi:hypothetical protein
MTTENDMREFLRRGQAAQKAVDGLQPVEIAVNVVNFAEKIADEVARRCEKETLTTAWLTAPTVKRHVQAVLLDWFLGRFKP